uniref:non-specific serine/threonine protein kinase n=1 Tax=Talaromyces marneffei PM1 TaxID=1077442 RepID=A0A093VM83_TALMA
MPKRNNRLFGGYSKGTTSINDCTVNPQTSEEKQSGPSNDSQQESLSSGASLVSKIRRGKVKLLSKLGLWNSGDTGEYSMNPLDLDSLCSTIASEQDSEDERIANVSNHFCPSSNDFPTTIEFYQQPVSTPGTDNLVSESFESAQASFEDEFYMKPNVDRTSREPVLARRLSLKLFIFGPSTVIRRAKTKARPGIVRMEGSCPIPLDYRCDGSEQDSTDQSAYISPIFSQADYRSSIDGVSTSLMLLSPASEASAPRIWSGSSRSAPSIQLVTKAKVKPSIVTAETAAVAKVFFETHFNAIHSPQDSRKKRFLELQAHLRLLPFTSDEQHEVQKAWAAQESEYLRQTRVLKTRSNRAHNSDTVSLAGYEVIGVLGQGSFGTVQLVKEKTLDQDLLYKKGSKLLTCLDGIQASKPSWRLTTRGSLESDGYGSGRVHSKPNWNRVYAMKVIRKAEMVRLCQEGHIRAEREILAASERSKWIVPLVASFQDAVNLYLVMEYEVGGDFFGLLIRQGVLAEGDTMWYVAEMILCVEEAHRLGWIHRDVKPENFLISASGHLKLADFGLAFDGHWSHNQSYFHNHRYSLLSKLGIDIQGDTEDQEKSQGPENSEAGLLQQSSFVRHHHDQTDEPVLDWRDRKEKRRFARSIVGTSQYMAPEIIAGEPYDGRCDYWSIGIILYECLYGMTPFYREDREETKRCIRDHRYTLHFPQDRLSDLIISYHAIDLIQRLLLRKEFRLSSRGYKINDCALWHGLQSHIYAKSSDPRNSYWKGNHVYRDDATDIKAHRWFRDHSWNDMLLRRPPYVPEERCWEDITFRNGANAAFNGTITTQEQQQLNKVPLPPMPDPWTPEYQNMIEQNAFENRIDDHVSKKRKHKEKKRARDKILRDAIAGPTALDVRTKGAFVGYTWRRPKPVRDVLEIERGRSLVC